MLTKLPLSRLIGPHLIFSSNNKTVAITIRPTPSTTTPPAPETSTGRRTPKKRCWMRRWDKMRKRWSKWTRRRVRAVGGVGEVSNKLAEVSRDESRVLVVLVSYNKINFKEKVRKITE